MARVTQADQAGLSWLRRLGAPEPAPLAWIPYDIPLRPGTARARVVLPADFAEADADRLCGVLRAIALPKRVTDG